MGIGNKPERAACAAFTGSGRSGWKKRAEALFFDKHYSVKEIAEDLDKSSKTVLRHISKCPGFETEKNYRRSISADRRRTYQREWDAVNRKRPAGDLPAGRYSVVNGETIRAEQIQAAKVLSREKY